MLLLASSSLKAAAVISAVVAISGAVPLAQLQSRSSLPSYALQYAPYVWLDTEEYYFPAAVESQLQYTHPEVNFTNVTGAPLPLTLNNAGNLNAVGGSNVYLSSNDDFTKFPSWLNGSKPDSTGQTAGGPSCAILVAEKPNNTVDVFYMYFYNFNLGNYVDPLGYNAGNHVGDWEHNAIRFVNGTPQSVWYSQHSSGEAFTYDAVEKFNSSDRIVSYSARGTHANYAITGEHDHTIPNINLPFSLLLTDYTSNGTLWDPTLNYFAFDFNIHTFATVPYIENTPSSWLNFSGQWGDDQLPTSDPRQREFLGINITAEWTGGPTGPTDKDLGRTNICPDGDTCDIKTSLGP